MKVRNISSLFLLIVFALLLIFISACNNHPVEKKSIEEENFSSHPTIDKTNEQAEDNTISAKSTPTIQPMPDSPYIESRVVYKNDFETFSTKNVHFLYWITKGQYAEDTKKDYEILEDSLGNHFYRLYYDYDFYEHFVIRRIFVSDLSFSFDLRIQNINNPDLKWIPFQTGERPFTFAVVWRGGDQGTNCSINIVFGEVLWVHLRGSDCPDSADISFNDFTFTPGIWHHIRVDYFEKSVFVFVDDKNLFKYENENLPTYEYFESAGMEGVGITFNGQNVIDLDNIKATEIINRIPN